MTTTNKKVLVTFPGKIGDILWSLATVKQIAKNEGCKVYFGIMPQYESLIPLLKSQKYIEQAFVIPDWKLEHSSWGDQPWQPPVIQDQAWDKEFHLGYRQHPGGTEPLIDFAGKPYGIVLEEPVVPWIDSLNYPSYGETYIAYAFNPMYKELKDRFLEVLSTRLCGGGGLSYIMSCSFVDTTKSEWNIAKYVIKHALCFVGCKSANYVLAHGIGQKHIYVFEPHPNRNNHGMFGKTFGNPYGKEYCNPLDASPENEAEKIAGYIKEQLKEKVNAIA